MKPLSHTISRGPVVAVLAVLTVALVSFVLFSSVAQPSVSPAVPLTPTAVRILLTGEPTVVTGTLPTKVPLPTRPPTPTSTPDLRPTRVRPTATPVQPITAWLTYTNTRFSYVVNYPNTWFLETNNQSDVYITSYKPLPSGDGGSILGGSVKIDIGVFTKDIPVANFPGSQPFCLGSQCGFRLDRSAPFTEPVLTGVNRFIVIRIPQGQNLLQLSVGIEEPPTDAERNAAIVEQIIKSIRFVR